MLTLMHHAMVETYAALGWRSVPGSSSLFPVSKQGSEKAYFWNPYNQSSLATKDYTCEERAQMKQVQGIHLD
ncbi:unnamed protein product [Caretta caretta]